MRFRPHIARLTLLAWFLLGLAACGEPAPVEVKVKTVGYDSSAKAPVVVLEDERRGRTLPIWIGGAEAHAIALVLEGVGTSRPMTHDLFKSVLEEAGVRLDKIVIESLEDATYFARLYLTSLRRDFTVDARPSDAIAIALRFGRPIYVTADLLQGEAGGPVARITSVARHGGMVFQDVSADLAEVFGVDPQQPGAVVTHVEEGSGAALRRGDVVLALDGEPVRSASQLARALAERAGKRVEMAIRRGEAEMILDFEVPQGR